MIKCFFKANLVHAMASKSLCGLLFVTVIVFFLSKQALGMHSKRSHGENQEHDELFKAGAENFR